MWKNQSGRQGRKFQKDTPNSGILSTANSYRIDYSTYFNHRYNPWKDLDFTPMDLKLWWKIRPTHAFYHIIGCLLENVIQ